MSDLIYKEESFLIIGLCMEVHKALGGGFLEIVYKDALEIELRNVGIPYDREKEFKVEYKGKTLPHKFYADFTIMDKIIIEIKGVNGIPDEFVKQTLNYLAVSKYKLGLIINFGREKLEYKRVVL
ncbi:MAG: GxxExxY protein [Ignavibacteriaceae bacterium]|nr:GxxExxY protein [Ignavibacteriaceae bacterium]